MGQFAERAIGEMLDYWREEADRIGETVYFIGRYSCKEKKGRYAVGRILWIAKAMYTVIRPFKQRYIAKQACNYYKENQDREMREVMSYVTKTGYMEMLNYPFMEKYKKRIFDVKKDKQSGLFFVNYHGRSMYLSREFFSVRRCTEYLRSILSEQDQDSPHRYLADGFDVQDGSIVIDAGAAEGIFSLDIVEKVSKLILVECDKHWMEALKKTFAEEIDEGKVVMVSKMLSDRDSKREVTLDTLYAEYGRIDFVKMDIEGGEEKALRGGVKCLSECLTIRLAVCAYHTSTAFHKINCILKGYGFLLTNSKGYLYCNRIFHFKPPYLRRGVIRAVKNSSL